MQETIMPGKCMPPAVFLQLYTLLASEDRPQEVVQCFDLTVDLSHARKGTSLGLIDGFAATISEGSIGLSH